MEIRTSDEREFISSAEWDAFSQTCSSGHVLQSWAWGELKSAFGWEPFRLAAIDSDRIVAGVQVLFRRMPLGILTTAYIPRGPMGDASLLAIPALHRACRQRNAIDLLVEPDWEDSPERAGWLTAHGYRPCAHTIQPRRTVVLDLCLSDNVLLAQMKAKTRYNIKLAERKGVRVRLAGRSDLSTFYDLLGQTSHRDGFGIHSMEYYALAWDLFAAQNASGLVLAEYEGKPLAALIVFCWGKRAYYMYGASSDVERQRMPTYLAQWHAMRWARDKGCTSYDLWGIPDLDDAEIGDNLLDAEQSGALSTGMGGLYRFKRGFGGQVLRYVATHEYSYQPLLARFLHWAWSRRSD